MQISLLSKIKSPADIKDFSIDELILLSNEIRAHTINVVSEIGGHLALSLIHI